MLMQTAQRGLICPGLTVISGDFHLVMRVWRPLLIGCMFNCWLGQTKYLPNQYLPFYHAWLCAYSWSSPYAVGTGRGGGRAQPSLLEGRKFETKESQGSEFLN